MTYGELRFELTLHACRAGGMTFGLAHADLHDAARAASALGAMREAWSATAGAQLIDVRELQMPNSRVDVPATRVRLRMPQAEGRPTEALAAFFARGTRVYQATVIGVPLDEDAAQTYFTGLRLQ